MFFGWSLQPFKRPFHDCWNYHQGSIMATEYSIPIVMMIVVAIFDQLVIPMAGQLWLQGIH